MLKRASVVSTNQLFTKFFIICFNAVLSFNNELVEFSFFEIISPYFINSENSNLDVLPPLVYLIFSCLISSVFPLSSNFNHGELPLSFNSPLDPCNFPFE